MSKFITTVTIIILLVLAVIGGTASVLLFLDRQSVQENLAESQAQVTELRETNEDVRERIAELEDRLAEMSEDTEDIECYSRSEDAWVTVNNPCRNQVLPEEFRLNGTAYGIFENNLQYKIEDAAGDTLYESFLTVNAPDIGIPGTYDVTVAWNKSADLTETSGTVIVYESSARDGSPIHVVEIPVRF